MKRCSKCGEWKSLAAFSKKKTTPDGFQRHCKACNSAYLAVYRAQQGETLLAKKRAYRANNLELERQYGRDHYTKNSEARRAYQQEYRAANPDKVRARKQVYRQMNSEKIAVHFRAYYQSRAEQRRASVLEWQRNNPDKVAARCRRRRARKQGAAGSHTAEQWTALCKQYGNRCLACGAHTKMTADHVIPLAKGGSDDISNIQPLCLSCNASKGTKTVDYRKDSPGYDY